MKAILYKKGGKVSELPIEKIHAIYSDNDQVCIALQDGAGEKWCEFVEIAPGDAKME